MKRLILLIFAVISILLMTYCLNKTRLGVGIRVLWQMIFPPDDLFSNIVETPIVADIDNYEFNVTNRFVGCYAVKIQVPMDVDRLEAPPFKPPEISQVRYIWEGGSHEQKPSRLSWSSCGEGPRTFSYQNVLVPIDVPKDERISVQVKFSKESMTFFSEHPNCMLSYGKDSDE